MPRIVALALVFLLARPGWAQGTEPPPPPDDGEGATPSPPDDGEGATPPPPPPAAPPAGEVSYFESCFGVPKVGQGPFAIGGEVIIPISGGSGGAPGIAIPSVGGDDRGKVLIAALALMALPVVVYAVDQPAPRLVLQRFQCPTFSLDFIGGADRGEATGNRSVGFVTTRLGFGVGHVAGDFEYVAAAPDAVSTMSSHLIIRPTPRAHIDGGLAIGYRRSVLGNRYQDGLELGLPHRYALWRDGLRTFALEVRPMLLIGASVEPSVEAAFLVPLASILQLRVGGRAYTFAGDLLWGFSGGLSLTL